VELVFLYEKFSDFLSEKKVLQIGEKHTESISSEAIGRIKGKKLKKTAVFVVGFAN